MKRAILIGGICFLLGAISLAMGATAIRPEQFIALPWSWTATQTFDGSHKITGLPSPSSSSDVATKGYVDSGVGGAGSVTSITCNGGLTGGAITTSGTCALDLTSVNEWSGAQTFDDGKLIAKGSSSGSSTIKAPATGGGTSTLPSGSGTLVYSTVTTLSSLVSIGTIATGVWNGTRLTSSYVPTDVAYLDVADQTVSGGANVTAQSQSTGSITVDCGSRPLQYITNGGAYTITAPSSDGSCILLSTNNGSAGAITFSGFSVGSSTGDALTTTNGNKFSVFIWRINGVSGYRVAAHQ